MPPGNVHSGTIRLITLLATIQFIFDDLSVGKGVYATPFSEGRVYTWRYILLALHTL